jgi:hypothetical protein
VLIVAEDKEEGMLRLLQSTRVLGGEVETNQGTLREPLSWRRSTVTISEQRK